MPSMTARPAEKLMEEWAFVALGSNLGDSVAILWEAIDRVKPLVSGELAVSSFWQTNPVKCPPGSSDFVNAVVAFPPLPEETPESLLERLQEIEREFGRPSERGCNEPRNLDLDLICFGSQRRDSLRLQIPHPRAGERKFVLAPMSELAPELIPPGWNQTVSERLAGLSDPEQTVRRLQRPG